MAGGAETELLGGFAQQWPLVALLMAVAGLVYKVMSAQHVRHAEDIKAREEAHRAELKSLHEGYRAEIKAIHERHEAEQVEAFRRLDAYAAAMVEMGNKHAAALLPVASSLEKLGMIQELRAAIRDDAGRRSGDVAR